jgi:hypothetical protein
VNQPGLPDSSAVSASAGDVMLRSEPDDVPPRHR